MILSSGLEYQRVDGDIVWIIGLLRLNDRTRDLQNFVFNVVQDQFPVFTFGDFSREVFPERLFMGAHGTGRQIEQFAHGGWSVVSRRRRSLNRGATLMADR